MNESLKLLKQAFAQDNSAAVASLLQRHPELHANINEPIEAFDSPLITRARSREMLDVLLDAGADINARSRWWAGGFGLLDSADPDLARYAIERGAIVDVHAAARLGLFNNLREMVTANPDLVRARGGDGQTPLHFASTIEIADYLLNTGADINARDIDHESTPAQYMVRDRSEIARYLVTRGCMTDVLMASALGDIRLVRRHLEADPGCIRMRASEKYFPKRNPHSGGTIYIWTLGQNKTAHAIAREFGHLDVFRLLMERSPDELKLAQACELGDEKTCDALLAARPNMLQTLSGDEIQQLAWAAQNNNTEAVRRMLTLGWPVDVRGQHGGSLLHWAAFHGNEEMVQIILRYHPPLDGTDNEFHSTPVGWATYGSEHGWYRQTGNYPATLEALLRAGAKSPQSISGSEAGKS